MINVQDFIGNNNLFKKFEVDELLFVEIFCPVEDDSLKNNLWWHHNFFAFAMAGEMVLKTLKANYPFKAGDCIFAKKGSMMAAHHTVLEDFCELRVFVPDDFIRSVVQKHKIALPSPVLEEKEDSLIAVATDEVLKAYLHSLMVYFAQPRPPAKSLLKLKFEELLVHLLMNPGHASLKHYFHEICSRSKPSVKDIMEANFPHNLPLQEFARLCARSLSAFKSEFSNIYRTSPGKWLREKRLQYARFLLDTTDHNVGEVSLISGFQNSSHFVKVFKDRFGNTPAQYRFEKNRAQGKGKNLP